MHLRAQRPKRERQIRFKGAITGSWVGALTATALALAVRGDFVDFEDGRHLVEGYLEAVVGFCIATALVA